MAKQREKDKNIPSYAGREREKEFCEEKINLAFCEKKKQSSMPKDIRIIIVRILV